MVHFSFLKYLMSGQHKKNSVSHKFSLDLFQIFTSNIFHENTSPFCPAVHIMHNATVPLVELVFSYAGTSNPQHITFKFDLSFSTEQRALWNTALFTTRWLRWQAQHNPPTRDIFRPLVLQVKKFARRVGLAGVEDKYGGYGEDRGTPPRPATAAEVAGRVPRPHTATAETYATLKGLSSYSWTLLVSFFLKHNRSHILTTAATRWRCLMAERALEEERRSERGAESLSKKLKEWAPEEYFTNEEWAPAVKKIFFEVGCCTTVWGGTIWGLGK